MITTLSKIFLICVLIGDSASTTDQSEGTGCCTENQADHSAGQCWSGTNCTNCCQTIILWEAGTGLFGSLLLVMGEGHVGGKGGGCAPSKKLSLNIMKGTKVLTL